MFWSDERVSELDRGMAIQHCPCIEYHKIALKSWILLCEFHLNEKKFNMSAYQDSLKKIKRKVTNWEIHVKQILNNMARIKNKKRMPIAHKETKPLKTKDIKHLFTEEETFKKCSTS